MPDLLILYANFYKNALYCNHTHVCVCLCVSVRAWERMFIPICICALDPGLYKNVKHFRFILGLLLFSTNKTNKKKNHFFHFSHSFSMWGQSDPKDLKRYFFFTPLEQQNQAQIFLCMFRLFRKVTESHAPEMKGTLLKNKGNFYWGQPDPKVWLRVKPIKVWKVSWVL